MRAGVAMLKRGELMSWSFCAALLCTPADALADDAGNTDCYSPTENLDGMCGDAAVGCPCNSAADQDVCINDTCHGTIGMMCEEGRWQWVYDGPCWGTPESITPASLCSVSRVPTDTKAPRGFLLLVLLALARFPRR
jgi:hypothetical protein